MSVLQTATLSNSCCDKLINRALLKGELDTATQWICPKCGCFWQPAETKEGWRNWSIHDTFAVWRI